MIDYALYNTVNLANIIAYSCTVDRPQVWKFSSPFMTLLDQMRWSIVFMFIQHRINLVKQKPRMTRRHFVKILNQHDRQTTFYALYNIMLNIGIKQHQSVTREGLVNKASSANCKLIAYNSCPCDPIHSIYMKHKAPVIDFKNSRTSLSCTIWKMHRKLGKQYM